MPNLSDLAGYGRDFLQGASNAAASNISAPVDGLAWLLNKGGMNIQNPVGGSDWMAQQGLTQQPQSRLAGLLGESVGGVAPMLAAAKAPQIASGINTMINNGLTQRSMNPQTGAVVWHGSPHKFDAFDASKIGTGEGAQAYGNGLYVADSQNVAQGYKDTLAYKAFDIAPEAEKRGIPLSAGARGEFLRQAKVNPDPIIAAQRLQNANVSTRDLPPEKLADLFSAYQKDGGGNLYKVDLPDEHIARMLDWDKPLSQQHPDVRDFMTSHPDVISEINKSEAQRLAMNASHPIRLDKIPSANIPYDASRMSGSSAMSAINSRSQNAEAQMQAAGFPGVKYLDGGSRATGGTSNYVVFPGNEHMLTITQRNGQNIK